MTLDDPTPICVSQPGCAAMVRRPHGQWTACPGEPTHTAVVRRREDRALVRIFLCPRHAGPEPAAPITDGDRAELDGRIVQWDRAVAGKPWMGIGTVEEDQ